MAKEVHMILQERRDQLGISAAEVARRMTAILQEQPDVKRPTVSRSLVSHWENGNKPIPDEKMSALAEALEMEPGELNAAMRFVRTVEDSYVWQEAIKRDNQIHAHVQLMLMFLPDAIEDRPLEGMKVYTFTGGPEDVAPYVRALSLDQVNAAWDELTRCPYVHRVGNAIQLRFRGIERSPDRG